MGFLLRSNIFIGVCALALTYATFHLFELEVDLFYLLFVFGSTVLTYTVLRNGKTILQKDFPKEVIFTSSIAALIAVTSATQLSLNNNVLWILLILFILCAWYGAHWEGGFMSKISLRQAGWIKLLTIGAVWAIVTAALPLLMAQENLHLDKRAWFFIIQQLLFIILLTIPFDLKDHIREKTLGTRSLPVIVGEENAKKIARMLTLVFWALAGFGGMTTLLTASICSLLFLSWLNQGVDKKNLHQIMLKFDGLMLIQAILFVGFSLIW